VEPQSVYAGSRAMRPPDPTHPNLIFGNWHSDHELNAVYNFAAPVYGNLDLYASWVDISRPQYIVTFYSNGGSEVEPQSVYESERAMRPLDPTRAGWAFDNWYVDTSFNVLYEFSAPVMRHTDIYARWTPATVTFDRNGGDTEANPRNVTLVPPATTVGSLPVPPTWEGCSFDGWNTQADGMGSAFTATTTVMGNITVYAQWTWTPANININVNNATKYQYVRGFGGMSNAEFRLANGSASPDMTVEDVTKLYSKDPIVWDSVNGVTSGGLGLNMMRIVMYDELDAIIRVPGSDPPPLRGPGAPGVEPPQPEGWVRDHSDYFDMIKEVNRHGGYVIMVPWTFPVEYKTAGSTGIGSSGYINTNTFPELAQYFVNYLNRLNAEGAPIFAVSIQNEPIGIAYEGCRWVVTDNINTERDFIRILGPLMANIPGYGGGQATSKVWIGTGEEVGPVGIYQNNAVNDTGATGAQQYIQFTGRKFYSGMQNEATYFLNAGKEVWMTEHIDTTSAARDSLYPEFATWNWVWHIANEIYCSIALNRESAYLLWYLKRFYGLLGDGSQNTTWSGITNRGLMMSHFSKYAANTTRVQVTGTGSFVENQGSNAGSRTTALAGVGTLPLSTTTFNPTSFAHGNSDTGGQNQPTTKVLAFESMDGNSIIVIAFTPTRNDGRGGQDAGIVQINLPSGFVATSAELMRSNEDVRHQMETVIMNSAGTAAKFSLPRSNIVSVKFTK